MILENYKSGVILVYSMPRSGTTLFGKYIQRKFDLLNAGEIFHDGDKRAQETANRVLEQANRENKDFICKYFPTDDMFDQSKFHGRKKFYTVNLVRKNIAKQFTSLIIAITNNQWQTNGFGKFPSDLTRKHLDVDSMIMHKEFNKFVRNLGYKEKVDSKMQYDEVLIYEDIINYLNENKQRDVVNIPSVKPSNYNFIYAETINLLKSYIKNNKSVPKIVTEWHEDFQKNGFKT